ncbi:MAG: hypothetical protein VB110_04425 [Bacteroidales bacterium]|nr:hypothetical protein [Bacteroidales bacterium]
MKTAGIVLLILGIISTLGAIIGTAQGYSTSFGGLAFVVLGAFLMSRANKKKVEEAEKRDWEKGSSDKEKE